jgi:hypothetical protein
MVVHFLMKNRGINKVIRTFLVTGIIQEIYDERDVN